MGQMTVTEKVLTITQDRPSEKTFGYPITGEERLL